MSARKNAIRIGAGFLFLVVSGVVAAQSPTVTPGKGTPERIKDSLHPAFNPSPEKIRELDKSVVEMRSELKTMRVRLENINNLIRDIEKGPTAFTEESRLCLARQSLMEDFRAFQAGKRTEGNELVKSKADFDKALSAMDLRISKLGWCK